MNTIQLQVKTHQVNTPKMEKWRGKNAVITGTSAGIGVGIMKELARHEINVIALARRKEKVEEIVKNFDDEKIKSKIHAYKCDVSSLESIKETFKWIEEKFGTISILVNNAGCGANVEALDPSDEVTEKLNKIIDTNFRGLVHVSREGARLMKKSNDYGIIININSVVGHKIPFLGIPLNVYPPTKYAVTAFSEILRQELVVAENDKIRVTNLSPGSVKSEIVVVGGYAKSADDVYNHSPHLVPEDIAESIIYLLSTPTNVNVTQLTISPVGEKS